MSVKTLNLFDSDATFNLTRDDTLEINFNRVAYPLSVVGTPTNCTVTPSSISATDKTFTVDFSASSIGSYSATLKNTGPDFGTDSDENFVYFNDGTNTNSSNTSITYRTDWGYVDASIGSNTTIFGHTVGYSRPITSYSSSNIIWTSTGGPYEKAETGTQNGTADRQIRLEIFTKWNTAATHRRICQGYVYSPEFTGESGDYITYTGNVDSTANNDKCVVWALNTGTGDWVEIQSDTFSGTRETLPANGTYRIIVFLYQYINSSSRIQQNTYHRINDFTRFNSSGVTKRELTVSGTVARGPSEIIKASQKQEVGDSLVNLFELTIPSGDPYQSAAVLYLHDGLNFETGTGKNIYFPNKAGSALNEYIAFPIGIDNLEVRSGESPRPKLSLANIPVLGRTLANDSDGTDDETNLAEILDDANLKNSADLLKTKVVCRSTLLKYTYSSTDTPTIGLEYPSHTFIIDRISNEEGVMLQVELASPADIEEATIPARLSASKYCAWEYQGGSLYNRGGCTVPGDSFSRYFDENDRLITTSINTISTWSSSTSYSAGDRVKTSPGANSYRIWEAIRTTQGEDPQLSKYAWKRIDVCGKRLTSCRLRFQGKQSSLAANSNTLAGTVPGNEYLDKTVSLPFGGFPGTKKIK